MILLSAAVGVVSTACRQHEIETYRVPKETNQVVAAAPRPAGPMMGGGVRPTIRWTKLPAGWKEGAGGTMRVASFTVAGEGDEKAEVSVTPLPGVSGIETDSLNMWRGELNLPPAEKSELSAAGSEVEVGNVKSQLYDFAGAMGDQKGRIIGAVLQRDGTTWFFKMRGSDALVAAQKEPFKEFLKTVVFNEAPAPAPASVAASAPPAGNGSAAAPADQGHKPKWEAPSHWQSLPPKTMLVAAYAVGSGEGGSRADVTVSSFPGEVGGLAANVNRWRGQIGLKPVPEGETGQSVRRIEAAGLTVAMVDLKNPEGPAGGTRLIAVIVPHDGMSWFFKISGPESVVSKEEAGFLRFIQSIKFDPHG